MTSVVGCGVPGGAIDSGDERRRIVVVIPRILGWIALGTALVAAPAHADHIRVYVLTGQSNSLGTTSDPNEPDVTPGEGEADAQTMFYWSNVSTSYPPFTLYGDSGGRIVALQAQQGAGNNPMFWGPEFGFARAMYDAGERGIMIVKVSRGGGGNTWWSKADGGLMYSHLVEQVDQAVTVLATQGHTFDIVGLMYLQGESDDSYEASVSGERLGALIENLRHDLPRAEGMRAVIGGIAPAGENRDVVRAQQAALAASDPTIDYFSNLDLRWSLYDGIHFNKAAKLIVGERYAAVFLTCRPDVNGDGEVNTLDLLAFLNQWSAGDGGADWNEDGSVNSLDVLAYLNEWVGGCG